MSIISAPTEIAPIRSVPRSLPARARNTVKSDYVFGNITGKPLTESINPLSRDIGTEIPRCLRSKSSNKISRLRIINLLIIERNSTKANAFI